MAIPLVYHHTERWMAQAFVNSLSAEGCDIFTAPLGGEIVSPHWLEMVRHELDLAEACIVLLSKASVGNGWVGRCLRWAAEKQCLVLGVAFEGFSVKQIQKMNGFCQKAFVFGRIWSLGQDRSEQVRGYFMIAF